MSMMLFLIVRKHCCICLIQITDAENLTLYSCTPLTYVLIIKNIKV